MMLTSEFWAHREFLDLIEGGLRSNLIRKAQELEAAAKAAGSEDEFDELITMKYEYELESEGGQFMTIVFNSFFAASFALFEHTLFRICHQVQRDASCRVSVSGRDRISSAKKYLVRFGIEFPSHRPEWGEMKLYREIRNKIMHEGATLPVGNRPLSAYAKEKRIISWWGEHQQLELTRTFCEEALENLTQFSLETHRAYSRWRQAKPIEENT